MLWVSSVVMIEVGEVSYQLIARHEAHKRIIWTCSWNPYCHEFATGSRDRTVKIWAVQNGTSVKQLRILPQFKNSVTALSWVGHGGSSNGGLLAIGMDDGLIELWRVSGGSATPALRFHPFLCHVSTVHRLAWRRNNIEDRDGIMQLASCGADHSVRVFQVNISR